MRTVTHLKYKNKTKRLARTRKLDGASVIGLSLGMLGANCDKLERLDLCGGKTGGMMSLIVRRLTAMRQRGE